MNTTLKQRIKELAHAGLEKNMYYEKARDKDDYVEEYINKMTHIELLEYIEMALTSEGEGETK